MQGRAVPSCNMLPGVMAPPLLPVGVATPLPGRYTLHPALCSPGSGGELDLSERKTSEHDLPVTEASDLSRGLSTGHTELAFYRKVVRLWDENRRNSLTKCGFVSPSLLLFSEYALLTVTKASKAFSRSQEISENALLFSDHFWTILYKSKYSGK